MQEPQKQLFELLHSNPKATKETLDRGLIVNVVGLRSEDGTVDDKVMFVVDNPELAQRLYDPQYTQLAKAVLNDDPSFFGLKWMPVSTLPRRYREEWSKRLTEGKSENKER